MRKNSKKECQNIGTVGSRSGDFYYKMKSGESVRSYSDRGEHVPLFKFYFGLLKTTTLRGDNITWVSLGQ